MWYRKRWFNSNLSPSFYNMQKNIYQFINKVNQGIQLKKKIIYFFYPTKKIIRFSQLIVQLGFFESFYKVKNCLIINLIYGGNKSKLKKVYICKKHEPFWKIKNVWSLNNYSGVFVFGTNSGFFTSCLNAWSKKKSGGRLLFYLSVHKLCRFFIFK